MFCKNCGKEITNPGSNCPFCGNPLVVVDANAAQPVQSYAPAPSATVTPDQLPSQYRPLGAWAYFGLSLLFAVPVVGLVFLIVFSFNSSNINRRSFARSFWCWFIIAAAIFIVLLVLSLVTGSIPSLSSMWNSIF